MKNALAPERLTREEIRLVQGYRGLSPRQQHGLLTLVSEVIIMDTPAASKRTLISRLRRAHPACGPDAAFEQLEPVDGENRRWTCSACGHVVTLKGGA